MQKDCSINWQKKDYKIKKMFIGLIMTLFCNFALGEIADPLVLLTEFNKGYIDIGANESDEKGVVDLTLAFTGGGTQLLIGSASPKTTEFTGKMNIIGTNLQYTLSGLPDETVSENFTVLANLSGVDAENFELTTDSKNSVNFTVSSDSFAPINGGITVFEKNIFANGNSITIIGGTTDNYSNIYYTNDLGKTNIQVGSVSATPAGYDLSEFRIYGGSKSAELTGNTNIKIEGGKVLYIYGGGGASASDSASSTTTGDTRIILSGGIVGEGIIGGGNFSAIVGNSKVEIIAGSVNSVYGGGNNVNSTVSGNTEIIIKGGNVIGKVYGGGKSAAVFGNSIINISGGMISGKVCGGGVNATATVNSCEINISGGTIFGDVLSAGNLSGNSNVTATKALKIGGNPKIDGNPNIEESIHGIRINGGTENFTYGFDNFEITSNLSETDKKINICFPLGFESKEIATSLVTITKNDLVKFNVKNIEGKKLSVSDDQKGIELSVAIYQITFTANGGIGDDYVQDFTYNVAEDLKENTFSRDGSTFLGWAESEDGVIAYLDKASYNATSDKTLYAKWQTLTEIVVSIPPKKTKYFTNEYFNPSGMEVKANYSDATSKVITNYSFTPNSALALTNEIITISYSERNLTKTTEQPIKVTLPKIILDENGGRLGSFEIYRPEVRMEMPIKDVNENDLLKPERPGYIFEGYFSEKEEGGYQYYGEKMQSLTWNNDLSIKYIYARWKADKIYVFEDSITWAIGADKYDVGGKVVKIKPTMMKESVKLGTSLQFDIVNKFCDVNKKSIKAPKVYNILSAKLADSFSDIGTIEVIGGKKIKFTPKPFYYTTGFNSPLYADNAVKFTYEVSADVSGRIVKSEFTGFIAIEPVNQAPNIWVDEITNEGKISKYLVNVITEKDYLGNALPQLIDADEDDIKIVSRPSSILTVVKDTNGDVKWTKDKNNIYTATINVLEGATGEATITINVEDENNSQLEYVGKSKDLSAKLVYKINLGVENKNPSFNFNTINQDGENGFCSADESVKPAVQTVKKVLENISAGTDEVTQKVKFNILVDNELKGKFKKLPTLKINNDKTADISFMLAPNVCEDIKFTILAIDSGVPVKEFSREFTIKVKPLLPTVKSFMIYARDKNYNFVQTSMIGSINYFAADFIFSDRVNVDKTQYVWTINDVKYFDKEIEVSGLKVGDVVTLKIRMEDNFIPAQESTWEKSLFVGNPEWYPAVNLRKILPDYCEENGTYQITMTQGKITNKVTAKLDDFTDYIYVSDYIAAKAKGFLPNEEVKITAIAKAIDGKLQKATLISDKSFIISDYGMPDQTVDFDESANLKNGIFYADIKLLDATGFDYEVWGGEIENKLKKIITGKIVFTDKDYYGNFYELAAQNYRFEHSVSFTKIINSDVYYQLKIRPFNPLYTPKSFVVTRPVSEAYVTPTEVAEISPGNIGNLFLNKSVYDLKNAKNMVNFYWFAIKNVDFYTIFYKQTHDADNNKIEKPKEIKKKVGKYTYFDVALGKGKYTWSLQTTTNVKKDKITATPSDILHCGEFIIK